VLTAKAMTGDEKKIWDIIYLYCGYSNIRLNVSNTYISSRDVWYDIGLVR